MERIKILTYSPTSTRVERFRGTDDMPLSVVTVRKAGAMGGFCFQFRWPQEQRYYVPNSEPIRLRNPEIPDTTAIVEDTHEFGLRNLASVAGVEIVN